MSRESLERKSLRDIARLPKERMSDGIPAHAQCDDIIDGKQQRIAELEAERNAALATNDCSASGGWLTDDLECAIDSEPCCYKHYQEWMGAYKRAWSKHYDAPYESRTERHRRTMDATLAEEQSSSKPSQPD